MASGPSDSRTRSTPIRSSASRPTARRSPLPPSDSSWKKGKLEWDAPVVRYLPWFQLSDSYVTRELTIRDLLVHRSGLGLGAGDLLWWPPTTYTRNEVARRLKSVPLATSFRSTYAYDNVLYLVAGEVIQAVSGLSWEEFVTSRILRPVGMLETTVRHGDAGPGKNMASPHAPIKGKVQTGEAIRQRQHESCRRDQFKRRRDGTLDDHAT